MQAFYKRFSVIAGFLILLVVLVAAAYITRRQLGMQIEDQAWAAHTRKVLFELSQTELLLTDAETGQRGLLYTGDAKYLAPYDLAVAKVEPHIQTLARLTADNARQQARISVLRSLAQEKLSELAQTISFYQAGRADEAKALVLSDAGLVTMNKLRNLLGEMIQEEESLEALRTAAYQRSIRVTIASIYLASTLAALGLILLAFYILREMDLREKHAAQIRQREEWYRVTLTSIGDGVIATDEQGRVTFLNPLAERLTGTTLAQAQGQAIQEVFPIFNEQTQQPVENPVKKVMELGTVIGLSNHTTLRHRNGTLLPIRGQRGSDSR
jgi:PAS domain S-box-containing protein